MPTGPVGSDVVLLVLIGRVGIRMSYVWGLTDSSDEAMCEFVALGTITPVLGTAYSLSSPLLGSPSDRQRIWPLENVTFTLLAHLAWRRADVVSTELDAAVLALARPRAGTAA